MIDTGDIDVFQILSRAVSASAAKAEPPRPSTENAGATIMAWQSTLLAASRAAGHGHGHIILLLDNPPRRPLRPLRPVHRHPRPRRPHRLRDDLHNQRT
ncbi:hypothetical protein [Streptomyces sp. NPDC002133]|uniref:hypothetical protein n=1 Tax=Streptomyces sp. NPDC002133 TaxID=3154409 RepID=UPI00332B7EC1